jgi:isopentenyl-diphosphate delta-isomerase
VVLVNADNQELGTEEVMKAHQGDGMLHRAVSVLVYRNSKNGRELLLQKRGSGKPLWPLHWTNTVCTHPLPGEDSKDCAVRRLREEMGIRSVASELRLLFYMQYQARFNEALSEHELDAVFLLKWDGIPMINRREAAEYKWVNFDEVFEDIHANPSVYTPWFASILSRDTVRDALRSGS